MKKTFYFSHDYNTREDEKIQNVIFKLGYEGYGLFWAVIEMLYQNDGYLQKDFKRIAFILRSHENIIKQLINDFELFIFKEEYFYSHSILARLKERKNKSQKAKKSAQSRWDKEKANNANALRKECDSNAIKERKGKDIKVNKIKVNDIEEIYKLYPSTCPVNNSNTGKGLKNKEKIKQILINESKEDLVKKINWYISDCKKSKRFIKNFGTFLNNLPDDEEIKNNSFNNSPNFVQL